MQPAFGGLFCFYFNDKSVAIQKKIGLHLQTEIILNFEF